MAGRKAPRPLPAAGPLARDVPGPGVRGVPRHGRQPRVLEGDRRRVRRVIVDSGQIPEREEDRQNRRLRRTEGRRHPHAGRLVPPAGPLHRQGTAGRRAKGVHEARRRQGRPRGRRVGHRRQDPRPDAVRRGMERHDAAALPAGHRGPVPRPVQHGALLVEPAQAEPGPPVHRSPVRQPHHPVLRLLHRPHVPGRRGRNRQGHPIMDAGLRPGLLRHSRVDRLVHRIVDRPGSR